MKYILILIGLFLIIVGASECNHSAPSLTYKQELDTVPVAALSVTPGTAWVKWGLGDGDSISLNGIALMSQNSVNSQERIVTDTAFREWIASWVSDSVTITGYPDSSAVYDSLAAHLTLILANSGNITSNGDSITTHRSEINTILDSLAAHRTDINAGGGSALLTYTLSASAPADTTTIWLDTTNSVFQEYDAKRYYNGKWSVYGYYNALDSVIYNQPCLCVKGDGQSNMYGGAGSSGGDRTIDNRVSAWNGTSWVVANLDNAPFRGSSYSNILFHYGKEVARNENRCVRIILNATTGIDIDEFVPQGSTWYAAGETKLTNSGMVANDRDYHQLWLQGEADRDTDVSVYQTKWNTLKDQWRAETYWKENNKIIVVGVYDDGLSYSNEQNEVFRKELNNLDEYTTFVNSNGVDVNTDSLHYTAAALKTLAKRAYGASLNIPYQRASASSMIVVTNDTIDFEYRDRGVIKVTPSNTNMDVVFQNPQPFGTYRILVQITGDTVGINTSNYTLFDVGFNELSSVEFPDDGLVEAMYLHPNQMLIWGDYITGPSTAVNDTLSFATTSPTSMTESPTGVFTGNTGTFSNYGLADQYLPGARNGWIEISIYQTDENPVIIALDATEESSKYNGTNTYDYGAYFNSLDALKVITEGVVSDPDTPTTLSENGEERLRVKRDGGTITIEYSNNEGSSWSTVHTFAGSNLSTLYGLINIFSGSEYARYPIMYNSDLR